ncbi:MAG: polyprenyl diphosphate synthase, partial [Erysipelotrichaceae bacterium]|nr:polyprenyl diphosphate synthase [Erysipelotrichaceae bacterium]
PEATRQVLLDAADESKDNTGLNLVIAINYGSHDEIVHAAVSYAKDVKEGKADLNLTPEKFEQYLYTKDFPPVDLLIRTSGEQRISNYLLWQIAYAELEFIPESWPEFTPDVLKRCLEEYSHRDRRFGGVKDE